MKEGKRFLDNIFGFIKAAVDFISPQSEMSNSEYEAIKYREKPKTPEEIFILEKRKESPLLSSFSVHREFVESQSINSSKLKKSSQSGVYIPDFEPVINLGNTIEGQLDFLELHLKDYQPTLQEKIVIEKFVKDSEEIYQKIIKNEYQVNDIDGIMKEGLKLFSDAESNLLHPSSDVKDPELAGHLNEGNQVGRAI